MALSEDVRRTLRQCSKDDAAYQELVALFEQQQAVQSHITADQLHESQAVYRSLVDSLPMNVYRIKPDGRLTFVNQPLLASLGMPLAEVIGKTAYDFYPHDLAQKYREDDMHVIQTGETFREIEINISPSTHEVHYVEVIKVPIFNKGGEVVEIQGIFWDITERKQVEEHLRNRERELRTILDNSTDLITRLDRDGFHLYANVAYARAVGMSVDKIIGKSNDEVGISQEMTNFDAIRQQVFETGNPFHFQFAYQINGEERFLDSRLIPEFDTSGRVVSMLSTVRDITDEKLATQREFKLALERERVHLLSRFVMDAGHEFRTPLASINSAAYLMARYDDPERRHQKAALIDEQIFRIARLVDMLLLMAKVETSSEIPQKPVNINALIDEITAEAHEHFGDQPTLVVDVPANLPFVAGNAEYLERGLWQIVDNAYRYTTETGVVKLEASATDRHLRISVTDNGLGIPEADMPHIFDTFWRRDLTHTTPGFGLGLPIALKIIETHRGKLTVNSTVDAGTCVQVTLPTLNWD